MKCFSSRTYVDWLLLIIIEYYTYDLIHDTIICNATTLNKSDFIFKVVSKITIRLNGTMQMVTYQCQLMLKDDRINLIQAGLNQKLIENEKMYAIQMSTFKRHMLYVYLWPTYLLF